MYKKKEAILEKENDKFKTRLIAKDYLEKQGVDYDKIFSSVVKHTSMKSVLSLIMHFDIELEHNRARK